MNIVAALKNRKNWKIETLDLPDRGAIQLIVVLDYVLSLNEYGTFRVRECFSVEKGKHYVGTYGKNTPIMGGSTDDIYFGGNCQFDGEWTQSQNITKDSGTGRLYAALAKFASNNSLT